MKIAVLIPCYNEESTVAQVIADMQANLPEADIYVYDNNSSDNTFRVASDAGAIVRREPVQGKGNVIRSMFTQIDADVYLMIDGDNTYPAKQARSMVNEVVGNGIDMVVGDRLSSTYFMENKRVFHNSGNRLVRFFIRRFWHTDIHDIMTGYRAFSRRFVKLFPVMSPQFEIETEMTIHALDKRFRICEIPVEYRDRPHGSFSKLNTFRDGIKVIKTIFMLYKEYRPLRFFSWFAIILAVLAFSFFIPVFIEYLKIGLVPRFPTLIVSMFCGLAALQSFFTGLCLDVIVTKDRKAYELRLINFK